MTGEFEAAWQTLDELAQEDPFDWRVSWYRGKGLLAKGDPQGARNEFGKVYFEMPGEVAPKLAIGFALEKAGQWDDAANYYRRVSKIDPNYTTACFGYARCLRRKGQLNEASQVLNMVPASHAMFLRSRIVLADMLMHDETRLTEQLLEEVGQTIEGITVEGGMVHQLSARLFKATFTLIGTGKLKENSNQKLLGSIMQTNALRLAAESAYRKAAKYAKTEAEKIELVDKANSVRPVTMI
jgi:serine/threonine-protein kinase PknG